MSTAHQKVAQALLRIGNKNVPQDTHLVYVNDDEYADLVRRSGPGEPDRTTSIEHFDDDGGDDGGYSSDQGDGGESVSNSEGTGRGGGDEGWGGGGNTYNDGLESSGVLAGTTGQEDAVSGLQGPSVDNAAADAEYTSIYGEAPGTPASSIGQSFADYMNEVNAAGYAGRSLGTLYDAYQGGQKGAALGPMGMIGGALLGGFTGKNGDRGEAFGRSAVQDSLLNGTWHNTGPSDDGGNGQESEYSFGPADEAMMGGGAPGEYFDPSGANVWSGLYRNYVPASAESYARAPSVMAAPQWYVPGSGNSAPAQQEGPGYDSVDFLERQKKEAAVRQALLAQSSAPSPSRIPLLEDYLNGKF